MVLDEKEVSGAGGKQNWLQVQDAAGRNGWMKSDQVLTVAAKKNR